MKEVIYTVHIEPTAEGGYVAFFPALPGCHTQGETLEEVIAMAKDALEGFLEVLQEQGEPLPVENRKPVPVELGISVRVPTAG
jgi:predicted RNase H-like HicB family nuclease